MAVAATAPACTTQNMPGLPSSQKKSRKSRLAWPPRRMEVASPTRVAAPCKLEAMATAMTLVTGEIPCFLAILMATGATISTVATLSTKAEMMPENRDKATMAQRTVGVFSRIMSASKAGMRDSMNKETIPMVPAIIKITFQSIKPNTICRGTMPTTMNIPAETSAICGLKRGSSRSSR